MKRYIAALLCAVMLIICAGCNAGRAKIMTVDGYSFGQDDFAVYLMTTKENFETQNGFAISEDMLGQKVQGDLTWADFLRDYSVQSMKMDAIVRKQAAQFQLKLTADDRADIKSKRENYITAIGGAKAYNDLITSIGSSDGAFVRMLECAALKSKLYEEGFKTNGFLTPSTDEQTAWAQEYVGSHITIRHIMFATIDLSTGAALPESEIAAKHAAAEDVLAQLHSGADFADLMVKHSDDYSTGGANSFTFAKDDFTAPEVEEAAWLLKEGAYSDIVKSSWGYHIIVRDKLDSSAMSTFVEIKVSEKFQTYLLDRVNAADITYTEAYDRLTVY